MRGAGRFQKEKWIMSHVTRELDILHVGCTNAPNLMKRIETDTLLHKHLLSKNSRTAGIDIDHQGIKHLSTLFPRARFDVGDALDLSRTYDNMKFDLIIAGDIIEHLDVPGKFLESCRNHLKPGAKLMITTTNCFGISRILKIFLFHEAVHDEHTAYYSPSTLRRLASMNGYLVEEFGYYAAEPLAKNFNLNRVASNIVEGVFTVAWPQMSEGVVAVFTKDDEIESNSGYEISDHS